MQQDESRQKYDIFLSHAAADAPLVDEAKERLQSAGFSVYVDRWDDPQLDRGRVTRETAQRLRDRMRQCRVLVLAVTRRSASSRWIPWELGYFDGYAGEVFVYPLDPDIAQVGMGQEYLDLYDRLDPADPTPLLRSRVVPLREALFRGADAQATADYGRRTADFGPQLALDPTLALRWQAELVQAWLRLYGAWWSARDSASLAHKDPGR